MGDREVLGQVVELNDASPPLRIVYSVNTGIVRGTVTNGACAMIVLLSNPLVPPFATRVQRCKAGPIFEMRGIPPGPYYTLAFDRVDPTNTPDDVFLRNITQNAATVEVGQGAAALVQLTITHWPD